MTEFLSCLTMLAEAVPKQREPSGTAMLLFFLPAVVLFYFIVLRPASRERKRHEQLLSSLKKNDRVLTAGGIIGSVANISPDGKEITLKVDDNTRIKFHRNYISTVLTEEKKDEPEKK